MKILAGALLAATLVASGWPDARAATVQVTVDVPPGKTKTVRLRKLPEGAAVAVRIRAEGQLRVALVSVAELKSPKPEAIFRGAFDREMSFQVRIPAAGDYVLVLDNRRGTESVKTRATIQARPPAGKPKPDGPLKETRLLREHARQFQQPGVDGPRAPGHFGERRAHDLAAHLADQHAVHALGEALHGRRAQSRGEHPVGRGGRAAAHHVAEARDAQPEARDVLPALEVLHHGGDALARTLGHHHHGVRLAALVGRA
jgi:hypothetical protein